jgi:NADPH:quinone reductase-like Zn-dependent oxidoreductase
MRAVVQKGYGPPELLRLNDVEIPDYGDREVLVRVRASSVNPYDWHFVTGRPYLARLVGRGMGLGLRGPLSAIRGFDVAGVVEAVGSDVRGLRPGDEVFGWCDGAFADYVSVAEDSLVRKPRTVTFEQAAAVPMAGLTALQALRDHGRVRVGQRVLVNSASGGVGTFAVQLAKAFGAEVTGVCSTRNVEQTLSIGADHAIDYTRDDFTRGGQWFDLIIDSAVSHPMSDCRRVLAPDGTYVLFGNSGGNLVGGFRRILQAQSIAPFTRQRLRTFTVAPRQADLVTLGRLIEEGLVTPIIDRSYPLAQVVPALDYLEAGHSRGKVAIIN